MLYRIAKRPATISGLTGLWVWSATGISNDYVKGVIPTNRAVGEKSFAYRGLLYDRAIGMDLDGVTAAQQIHVGRINRLFQGDGQSVLLFCRRNGTTNERGLATCSDDSSDGGLALGPANIRNRTNGSWQVAPRGGGPSESAGFGMTAGFSFHTNPTVYLATHDGNGIGRCYQDGILTNTKSSGFGSTLPNDNDWGWSGSGWDSYTSTDTTFFLGATFNRALTEAEAWRYRDPRRLIADGLDTGRIYSFADAAATNVAPTAATLTLTGASPAVALKINRTLTAGALTLTGEQPSVETVSATDVVPTAASLTLAGASPGVALIIDRTLAAAALTIAGQSPGVALLYDISPTADALTLTGESPTVTVEAPGETVVNPNAGTLTLTGQSPTVSLLFGINPAAAALSITGQSPDVRVAADQEITPTAGTLTLAGASPSIAFKIDVTPSVAALSITGETLIVEFPPQPTAAPDGGGGGAKKYRQSKYPRRVSIDGRLYWVKSAEEERALLEAYRARLEQEALELALEDAPKFEVKKARAKVMRITKRIAKVDDRAEAWMDKLRQEDEEIVMVMGALH